MGTSPVKYLLCSLYMIDIRAAQAPTPKQTVLGGDGHATIVSDRQGSV